ncbi:MAG: GNAT family protein [Bacteroidota bacterium]
METALFVFVPMPHQPTVTLRPLHQQDIEPLARLANSKKIWDNVRDYFPHPYSQRDAKTFINNKGDEDPTQTFAIEYQGEFAGVMGLERQHDVYRYSGEVGYWLGEPYWGKGIASQALKDLTDIGFTQFPLERLYAGVFSHNQASIRVLQKVGYQLEVISPMGAFKNGQFVDEHRYVMLRRDWVGAT